MIRTGSLALISILTVAGRAASPPASAAGTSAETTVAAPAVEPAGATEAGPGKAGAGETAVESDATSLLSLGRSLTERSQFEDAEIAFRQVLESRTSATADIKAALVGFARMHRKQGALTKAAAIYERFLADYPGDDLSPEVLLELGRTLRALGSYKTAIARFYGVLTATLKLPGEGLERYQQLAKTAQFEIAETHFQSGSFAEAAKFYSRLRLLDLAPPDRARAHFKAAFSLHLLGDLEKAVSMLQTYIEQSPDDENIPEARYLLATTLRQLKRTQDAFVVTLELLRAEKSRVAADPKRWAYWQRRTGNQLANDFFESGNTLNAHAIYTGLVELSPDAAWRIPIIHQIALCYERMGSFDRARASYQSILDMPGHESRPELAELIRMAAWRLEHLAWRSRMGGQIGAFFDSAAREPDAAPAAPASRQTAVHP